MVFAGFLLPALCGADKKKPAPPSPVIAKLAWLAGNWRMEKSGRVIDQQWLAPVAGVMRGLARTIVKGRVVEHAFVQFREGPGGDLFFVSQPSGQKETTSRILSRTEAAVVFDNPAQDFPQKISFTLQPGGPLFAILEGAGPDEQVKRCEFAYQRVVS